MDLQTSCYRFLNEVSYTMWKTFENRFFSPVLVGYNTLAAKTMPGAIRLRARAVNVDLFSNRAHYVFLFHRNSSFKGCKEISQNRID